MTTTHLITPPGTPWSERIAIMLYAMAVVFLEADEARWRWGFETYTCTLGDIHGGTQ